MLFMYIHTHSHTHTHTHTSIKMRNSVIHNTHAHIDARTHPYTLVLKYMYISNHTTVKVTKEGG